MLFRDYLYDYNLRRRSTVGHRSVTTFTTRKFDSVSNKVEVTGATLKIIVRILFEHTRRNTGHRSVTPYTTRKFDCVSNKI